ncbi:MAG: hypothetical protein QY310_01795 [Candidatus Jettenia sp. CY-1]|nr:MAG: hypothetical protein QY310_01795 [Candidatus Jettenia sp. CY-1]
MGENHLSDSNQIVIWDILHYLIKNSDAKDTIDDILKWWVPKVIVIEQEKSKVQEALEMLVEKGFITEWETNSSWKYYGVTENQLEEIKNFLQKPGCEDKQKMNKAMEGETAFVLPQTVWVQVANLNPRRCIKGCFQQTG